MRSNAPEVYEKRKGKRPTMSKHSGKVKFPPAGKIDHGGTRPRHKSDKAR